jgi:general stress protein YciG
MSIKKRGFASMSKKRRIEIARLGGKSGGPGRGWKGNSEGHSKAGKIGGRARAKKLGFN